MDWLKVQVFGRHPAAVRKFHPLPGANPPHPVAALELVQKP